MSLRYYHRTGPDSGYSNGPIIESLRSLWTLFIVLVFAGALVGALEGNAGSAVLFAAMVFGGWLGLRRR